MSTLYYCTKCKQKHITRKAVGQSHLEFAGEAPKGETDKERLKRTVNLCESCIKEPAECGIVPLFGTGIGNDNVYECRGHQVQSEPTAPAEVKCELCQDTGFVTLGVNARAFCKCGQETHDERIGLMPRRPDLGPAKPISDRDRAEAAYRRSHGGTHDEYVAQEPSGGGDPEPPSESDESKEPEAHRLDGAGDETVLQEAGDGVPDRQGDSTV